MVQSGPVPSYKNRSTARLRPDIRRQMRSLDKAYTCRCIPRMRSFAFNVVVLLTLKLSCYDRHLNKIQGFVIGQLLINLHKLLSYYKLPKKTKVVTKSMYWKNGWYCRYGFVLKFGLIIISKDLKPNLTYLFCSSIWNLSLLQNNLLKL